MIYLDNNATTRLRPEVRDAMLPFLDEYYGNPSAGYRLAKKSREAIDTAREQVAAAISADPGEVVFTSCGTEANNSAILSAVRCLPARKHIITSPTEHSAVGKFCAMLEETEGYQVTRLPVDEAGRVSAEDVRSAIRPEETALITVMWANNETGVLQPIREIAEVANDSGVFFHTDAVQAMGKIPLDLRGGGIHLLSISGHKFHAPKGVGALYINRNARFQPLFVGGGQEGGRRAGTENVASIVAMGKAAEMAQAHLAEGGGEKIRSWRDAFQSQLESALPGTLLNGHPEHRTSNTANLSFEGIDARAMIILLDELGLCCSSGSACATGSSKPSPVLKAMGVSDERSLSSLRFSFGALNKPEDAELAVDLVVKAANRCREQMTPGGVRVVT